jgi:hypothetical protein
VAVDIKPLDELQLWSRPGAGELPRWVRCVILLACAVTVFAIGASTYVLWRMGGKYQHIDKWTFRNGPPLVMLMVLVVAFLPSSSVSRFVRMAIVLPLVHVLTLIVAWRVIPQLEILASRTPMTHELPVLPMALLLAGTTITVGVLIARRRRDRIHAIVMIALANLLLLGLWVPIAARLWAGTGRVPSWDAAIEAMASPGILAASMLVPPFLVATAFTAITIHRPSLTHRLRNMIAVGVFGLLTTSLAIRVSSNHGGFLLYDNFVHLILAVAMIAVLATCALSVTTWLASLRASRRLAREPATRSGVISDEDDHVVACLQITSWLRGPRLVTRPFTALVGGDELVIPAGIDVATTIPRVSSVLRTGEAVVVLQQGDQVELGGFVDRETGESPFRSAQALVPGPRGIVVGRLGEQTSAAQSMGLAAWRPSVAYLLIVIAVAAPGLLGLLSPTWK